MNASNLMCWKCRKHGYIKANYLLHNKDKFKNRKIKRQCVQHGIKSIKVKVRKTPTKKKDSLVASALTFEVTRLNWDLHSSIDQFDVPFYDELSYVFNELHNDITSLCIKNKELKLKVSSLLNELSH